MNAQDRRIKVYPDKAGDWRWRKWAGSRIVADSGEGYERQSDAVDAALDYGAEGDERIPITVVEAFDE